MKKRYRLLLSAKRSVKVKRRRIEEMNNPKDLTSTFDGSFGALVRQHGDIETLKRRLALSDLRSVSLTRDGATIFLCCE